MKERNPFFDNAKILLMVLVVLGHVLPINNSNRINLATYNEIFSFHMPLFVFISGYFTKVKKEGFWFGVLKLLETYVVFTIFHMVILLARGKGLSLSNLIIPPWALWYLMSLIWWRLFLYFLPESIRSRHVLLISLCIVLCLIAGWVPLGAELSFHRTFSFLPFFIIGYVCKQKEIIERIRINRYFCVVIFILTWFIYFIVNSHLNDYLFQNQPYYHFNSTILALATRTGLLLLASLLSICFLSLVPSRQFRWTQFGKLTLFIYMWHTIILSFRYVARDTLGLPTSLPFCLLYTAFTLALIYLMSKIRFFHWVLNPVTSIFKKKATT